MRYTKNTRCKLKTNSVVLFLSISLLFCSFSFRVLAQEQKSHIIPGRVMVKFKYDEIELPQGESKADIGRVNVRSANLKQALQRFKVDHFARVVPTAVKGDTLRVLPDGRTVKLADFSQLHLLRFPKETSVDSVVTALQKLDQVIYAEPDQFLVYDDAPVNDQYFNEQWYLQQEGGQYDDEDIDAPEAWEKSKGDGIKIAIIDLGVRVTHNDLVDKKALFGGESTITVVPGLPNHGTKVAGVAAAATHNTIGIAAVGYNAEFIPYDNENTLSGSTADIYAAVNAGADIINMSFHNTLYSSSFKDALQNAFAQGVTLVAAAGNIDPDNPIVAYPHAFDGLVTAVSATNKNGSFNSQSNYGFFVDVAAPGQSIKTTDGDHDNDYASPIGTSYSAPIVSGIVALLRAFEPELEDRDFERIIELSAEKTNENTFPYDANGWNDHMGHGRVNANQALDLVAANEIRHWTASGWQCKQQH